MKTYIKTGLATLTLTIYATLLWGCAEPDPIQSIEGYTQGTTYHIRFWSRLHLDPSYIQRDVAKVLLEIDGSMSGYREDSTIERFNAVRNTEGYAVESDIVTLVEQARLVHQASQGCYDLTIKPLFGLWGFSEDAFTPPTADRIQGAMKSVGMAKLVTIDAEHLRKTVPELRVDLSSIAQGYSVSQVAKVLEKYGIQNYLVEIGGELQLKGSKPNRLPWRVAVEKPLPGERNIEKIISINHDTPMAVMTSGTYRHFFDSEGVRYSHILDARTGRPVEHETVSVTVLYTNAAAADAWSTALLCLGSKEGLEVANKYGIPALFIDQNAKGLHELQSNPLSRLKGVEIK